MVTESLKEVEKKVEEACKRAGRERSEVTLIAVGKTKPVEMLSTRLNTMLMATSSASMTSVRTEVLDVLFISIVLPFRLKGTSRADAKRPPCATNRTKEGVNPTNFTSGQGGRPSRLHPSPCSSGMQILYRGYTFVHNTTPR